MPQRRDLVAALAACHERDRREVERIATARIARSMSRLQRLVLAAFDMGVPIHVAIRAGFEPVKAEIASASALAAMYGTRRTQLSVSSVVGTGTRLATTFDGAIDFLNRRLNLSEGELQRLRRAFDADAVRATGDAATFLETVVQEAIRDNTLAGGGVREGRRLIREAFTSAGFDPVAPHRAEAIIRTQTQLAYSAGRMQSLQEPGVQEILWGFEYTSAVDDRTTPLCRKLDGMRRPKLDPVWQRLTPPNHFNCRSTIVEIFVDDRMAVPTSIPPDAEPQQGFGFNPGQLYQKLIAA